VNNAGAKMLHYSKEEIIGKSVEEFFDLKNMKKQYEKKSGKGDIFEFALLTKRKNRIPVLFSEAELINAGGDKVGAVYVATDISERKKADQKMRESLKEKEILLSEIHHRVKNNLAVISGILQLQVYHTDNKKVNKALKESQSRIQSMSLVHEMLYQSESMAFINYKKYVNDLLQAISSMHLNEDRDIDIISEVEEVKFDLNQAIPCSLLLNEIIVNSYKHAFDDQSKGFIRVKMREEEGKVHLIVEDNGVGVTQETINTSESLGSTLIRTLTSQLKGTYEIGTLEDGTGTSIKVVFEKEPISEFKLK
jgi:PAS domain S-box-containing protein